MDADLDNLLDDALNDFEAVSLNDNKPPAAKPVTDEAAGAAGTSNKDEDALKQGGSGKTKVAPDEMGKLFEEEWMKSINELTGNAGGDSQQTAQMRAFQKEMMKGLDPSNPLFAPMEGNKDPPKSYEDAMKETLEFLSKGPDVTSSAEEDPLDKMFDEMMGAGGDGELGMMENMMKSMLSKDMLYPPMKEMCNEYPVWLEKKGGELPVNVRSNYEQQLSFLRQICHEFESEKDSDPEKIKNQRFQKIMELINSMQQYGQPPTDLMEGKNPLTPSPEACVIA